MLATVCSIIGVLAIFPVVSRLWASLRLLYVGNKVQATVKSVEVFGVLQPTLDDVIIVQMAVELPPMMKPDHVNLTARMEAGTEPRVGDVVVVLVDPYDPTRARLLSTS